MNYTSFTGPKPQGANATRSQLFYFLLVQQDSKRK